MWDTHAAVTVAAMAAVTALLRFAPFLIFRKGRKTPAYITYLGQVLPQAVIGMLVIYCLKDVSLTAPPFGAPELIAAAAVVGLQIWRKNSIISILSGTAIYMVLIRFM